MKLYLDVDGVVNARVIDPDQMKSGWATADGTSWYITWAPAIIAELATLPVELVWATTWWKDAPTNLAELIGWGSHGSVLNPTEGYLTWPSINWKTMAIARRHSNADRFIWIDDETTPLHRKMFPNALVITPDPSRGIRPEHVTQIREYINGTD